MILAPCHDATTLAATIAQQCAHATLHGDTWQACCPSHEDEHPSLSITPATDKVLLKCHAGCTIEAILLALGLTLKDLFVQSRSNGHKRIVKVYPYVDAHGTLRHETVRYDPKEFVQRRPDPANPGEYIWKTRDIETVLYNLPAVLQAVQHGTTIYIVEGEKDADTLTRHGLIATTNPMGAKNWRQSYTDTLRGAHVVLLPDNDVLGREHMADVAQRLQGTVASLTIVKLPLLPPKGDVTDWLQDRHHTIEDFHREVEQAPAEPMRSDQSEHSSTDAPSSVAPTEPQTVLRPGPEPTDPYACPELPARARTKLEYAEGASRFLDDYIAFSKTWAPRAYEAFHEAVALFALSTTAARRVKIELGPHGVYTSLYMALASRTSLFTKTTAVDIALALLRCAELQPLLADDDATPQAFLRSLTLHVPADYEDLPPEAQEAMRARLAFAGQKGWFYEEWGQHLHAMMQKEGQMAAFRGILRRMDDHKEEYVYSTISRGRDVLRKPYVALLANVTPADLKPFLRAHTPLWRDGYIARFAFVTPPATDQGSTAPFPEGEMHIPNQLKTALATWHKRLGIPRVTLKPILDAKGKPTGRYQAVWLQPHRETTYRLSPDVRTAFYAYDDALHTLMRQGTQEDLDGSYARFPMKALRIAGLLASLHDDSSRQTIQLQHWHRGQHIAERWRHDLHSLIQQVNEADEPSRESKGEDRILTILRKHGALSAMAIHKWTKLAHGDILRHLDVLQKADVVRVQDTGRTKKYHVPGSQGTLDGTDEV